MRVGLYDDPIFREHDSGRGHPERPERLDALRRGFAGLETPLSLLSPRPATREELVRVHAPQYVDLIVGTKGQTVRFDPDTQAGPRSAEAALLGSGAVLDAVERVLDGRLDRAFCVVRPPGHHALADRAMGFCLFNHVAVGAAHALFLGLSRVAILDFDVHHGNGTEAIFEEENRVLYVSSHAYPFYPGTGALQDVGRREGRGFTLNLPIPEGVGDGAYIGLYREIVEPVVLEFDPELVLVSAGFDAHERDPLAGMRLSSRGFGALMGSCVRCASGAARGRLVASLEGGYDLDALTASGEATMRVLQGEEPPEIPISERDRAVVLEYRKRLAPVWPILGA